MGNDLNGNPMYVDTAAALWTAGYPKSVRLIQWIDDAADIVDDDDLALAINGITFTGKIQLTANTLNNICVWQLGPFNPGMPVQSFTVTTIDHGILYIWFD